MCGGKNDGAILGAIGGAALAYATGGASLGLAAGTASAAAAGGVAGAAAGDSMIDKPKAALDQQTQAMQQGNKQAKEAATRQADMADQANNRANAKVPDLLGLSSQNQMASKGGAGSTSLTGHSGIDPKSLLLGKTTLIGG